MRAASIINFSVLVLVAAAAYFMTIYMDSRTPDVIIQPDAPVENLQSGETAPDFSFIATDGKTYTLRNFENKIIVLNFWASWCPPCIKEFPHFLTAAKEFDKDIIFIAVSSDLDEASMKKFLNKLERKIDAPNVFITLDSDQNITKNLFQTYRLPETILIDQNQIMRTKIIGADWSYENLRKQIEDLLK